MACDIPFNILNNGVAIVDHTHRKSIKSQSQESLILIWFIRLWLTAIRFNCILNWIYFEIQIEWSCGGIFRSFSFCFVKSLLQSMGQMPCDAILTNSERKTKFIEEIGSLFILSLLIQYKFMRDFKFQQTLYEKYFCSVANETIFNSHILTETCTM